MARPLPVDYLQEGETSLHQEGRHPLSVLDEVLWMTFLAALPITGVMVLAFGFYPQLVLPLAVPVTAVVLVLLGIFIMLRVWRVQTSLYTITPERTYKAYGRFRFFLAQTTYDKLTDMQVRQSLFGRWWGFGTVRLETAGTGIAFEGVRDPFGTKQRVEDARSAFLRTLIGEVEVEAVDDTRPQTRRVRSAPDATVWEGTPSPAAFIGAFVTAGLMLIAAAVFGLVGTLLAGPPALIVPTVLFVVAVFSLGNAIVQLRYTRFQVNQRGVVITAGWLSRRRVETTYEKVTDVTIYQGILGRLLGFGTITVNTAGSNAAPVVFQGVPRPEDVKQVIDDTRRGWERE